MTDLKSLVPVVAETAVAVSGNITNLVTQAKASGIVRQTQLDMLKSQTKKVLADAKTYHTGEIIISNLEQIAKTQELIDRLHKSGSLHGRSLEIAMEQLNELNNALRQILRDYLK